MPSSLTKARPGASGPWFHPTVRFGAQDHLLPDGIGHPAIRQSETPVLLHMGWSEGSPGGAVAFHCWGRGRVHSGNSRCGGGQRDRLSRRRCFRWDRGTCDGVLRSRPCADASASMTTRRRSTNASTPCPRRAARSGSFRPELVIRGETANVLVEQVGAVDVTRPRRPRRAGEPGGDVGKSRRA